MRGEKTVCECARRSSLHMLLSQLLAPPSQRGPEGARIASLIGTRDARAKSALGNGSRAKSTHSQQSKRGGQKQQGGPEPDDLTNTITLY